MQQVQLQKTERQREVEFEGLRLTLTRMEPVSWVPWVDGSVEEKAVYLSCIQCDFSAADVTSYLAPWCQLSNVGATVRPGNVTGRALVFVDNCFGEHNLQALDSIRRHHRFRLLLLLLLLHAV